MARTISDTIRPTRYPELGYRQDDTALWRIYAMPESPGDRPAAVGPHYRTKTELLADLGWYAREYGCPDATLPA